MSNSTLSRQLFVRIAPTIIVIVVCAGSLAFYNATREINRFYDAQMASNAQTLWAIVSDEVREIEQEKQKSKKVGGVDTLPGDQRVVDDLAYDRSGARMFRVWAKNHIVLFSPNAPPAETPRRKPGFSDLSYKGELWRVYALPFPNDAFSIEVGEELSLRQALVGNIMLDLLLPLLALIPATGVLLWLGIRSGLGRIRELVQQIRARSADNLSRLDMAAMPRDIAPVGDALNQLLQELERSFAAEKRFVDDAAHHLRTPLAALKLQLQMLSRTTNADEGRALTGDLLKSSERASKLVGQLLASARLSHQPVTLKPVPLYPAASAAIAGLGVLAAARHIELSLEGGEEARILADEDLLRLLLENLVENAIKYSPAHGTVEVKIAPEEKTGLSPEAKFGIAPEARAWKILIIDTGPGIPEDQRALVFNRFFRGNRAPSEGSGLGLSIVADILKKLSGHIRLGTAPSGTGLLAEVTLPGA